MLITAEYAQLNAQLHADRPDYGTSGQRWAPVVSALSAHVQAQDILDYGCGKQTLAKALGAGHRVRGYDPAVPELSAPPHPADLVVCTDVLEHVEPDCIDDVLDDLCRITQKVALITVATRPAVKTLADGRNAHLTIKPFSWWRESFLARFDVVDVLEEEGNEFTLILKALHAEDVDLSSFRLPRPEVQTASKQKPAGTAIPAACMIKVDGKQLKFTTPNRMTQWRVESLFTKEPDTIAWLQQMQAGEVLVDVGANVGMYSVFSAVVRGVKVFAFEPESQNYALLNSNIALNNLSGQVVAYPLALSDRSGADALYLSEFSAGGSCHSFGEEVGFDLKPRGSAFAQGAFSVPLDQLVSSGAVPVPDHIKLDVDGFEHKVIMGARETLSNPKVQSILVELNTHLEEHRSAIALLESLGFHYDPRQAEGALRASGAFQGVGEFIFTRKPPTPKVELIQRTTVSLPTSSRSRSVLHHVLGRLAQAEVAASPFPYTVIDDIFPADYYAEIQRHFPALSSMRALSETGRVGKNDYRERMTTLFTEEDFARLPAEQEAFWREFAGWMYSDTFLHAFIDKFQPALEPRIAKVQAAEGRLKVRGDALLVNDQTNYAIGPHTDAPHRLVTFLFYLPKDTSMRELGTSLYKPKKPGFTCWGGPHYPHENFEHVHRVEFLPNRLLAFPKTEHSFHGVERIAREDVNRHLLINNIRLLNQLTH
jgi:FkbM family methyltransferase